MQVVWHPNFSPQLFEHVEYMCVNTDGSDGSVLKSASLPTGYRMANSYKNYKTDKGVGHANGLFYEFTLYLASSNSNGGHDTRIVIGSQYMRDDSHDGLSVLTRGSHF